MKLLETQAEFEKYWFYTDGAKPECMRQSDNGYLIYFTAEWCKHCKKLDTTILDSAASARGFQLLKCDETLNDYTPGYCQIRSFPTFVFFTPKKIVSSLKSSVTSDVESWILAL